MSGSEAKGTEAVRAWIVETLRGLDGIGRGHDHERYAPRDPALRTFYVREREDGACLLGWFVRRASRTDERIGRAGTWRVVTRWTIRGYMALNDIDDAGDDACEGDAGNGEAAASEIALDALIDAMADAFRAAVRQAECDRLLARAPEGENAGGLRLEESGPVMFAGVLYDDATLALTTTHYKTDPPAQPRARQNMEVRAWAR